MPSSPLTCRRKRIVRQAGWIVWVGLRYFAFILNYDHNRSLTGKGALHNFSAVQKKDNSCQFNKAKQFCHRIHPQNPQFAMRDGGTPPEVVQMVLAHFVVMQLLVAPFVSWRFTDSPTHHSESGVLLSKKCILQE